MFLESILFFKNWKIQKQCCPVLATQLRVSQVACLSRVLAGQFWQLVRKWKVQLQGVHRDFRGSARDSLASETYSCEKYLAIFFSKLLAWSVLAGVSGDYLVTYLNRKKHVFYKVRAIFKIFFSFSSNFCDYSLSLSTVSFPNTPCHPLRTPFLLYLNSKSSRKRYGFSFSHFVFLVFELFPLDYMCWFSNLCWVSVSALFSVHD